MAVFPFSAIVGQEEMKSAILAAARGTGKSTAVRALAALLPEIKAV